MERRRIPLIKNALLTAGVLVGCAMPSRPVQITGQADASPEQGITQNYTPLLFTAEGDNTNELVANAESRVQKPRVTIQFLGENPCNKKETPPGQYTISNAGPNRPVPPQYDPSCTAIRIGAVNNLVTEIVGVAPFTAEIQSDQEVPTKNWTLQQTIITDPECTREPEQKGIDESDIFQARYTNEEEDQKPNGTCVATVIYPVGYKTDLIQTGERLFLTWLAPQENDGLANTP